MTRIMGVLFAVLSGLLLGQPAEASERVEFHPTFEVKDSNGEARTLSVTTVVSRVSFPSKPTFSEVQDSIRTREYRVPMVWSSYKDSNQARATIAAGIRNEVAMALVYGAIHLDGFTVNEVRQR